MSAMDNGSLERDNFRPISLLNKLSNNRGEVGDPDPNPNPDPDPKPDPDPEPKPDPKPEEKWYDGLKTEDLKAHPKIQEFEDADALAKSYLELQGVLGNEKIPVPKDAEDTVAIEMIQKALGVPQEASGYELDDPKVPEGLEDVMFAMDDFKALSHKHKLTPEQAKGIMNDYVDLLNNVQTKAREDFTKNLDEVKNSLKKEWGLTYEPKVKMAQDVMNKFTESKEEFDALNAKLGTDATALKFLAKVGENFAEGTLGDVGEHGSRFTKSPAEAKQEYEAIMNNPNDIYWSGVRNNNVVSESARKERISYVESLLRMSQPA